MSSANLTVIETGGYQPKSRFTLMAPVPVRHPDLESNWVIDGVVVQREPLSWGPDGAVDVVMAICSVEPSEEFRYTVGASDRGRDSDRELELPAFSVFAGRRPLPGSDLREVLADGPHFRAERRVFTDTRNLRVFTYQRVYGHCAAYELQVTVANSGPDSAIPKIVIKPENPDWSVVEAVDRETSISDRHFALAARGLVTRTFIVYPPGERVVAKALSEETHFGRAIGKRSYYRVGSFGPHKSKLPWLPLVGQQMQEEYSGTAVALRMGEANPKHLLFTDALGPLQPMENELPYMHGGRWIAPQAGWEYSHYGALLARVQFECTVERQRVGRFDQDGFYMNCDRWVAEHGELPIYALSRREDLELPGYASDKPPFHSVFDGEHGVRATRAAVMRWWFCGDFAARDYIEWCAEDYRLAWTTVEQDDVPSWGRNVHHLTKLAEEHPHAGNIAAGRELAWVMTTGAAAVQMRDPVTPHTQDLVGWLGSLANLCYLWAMPSGLLGRVASDNLQSKLRDAWTASRVPSGLDVTQHFEELLLVHGMHCVRNCGIDAERLDRIIDRSFDTLGGVEDGAKFVVVATKDGEPMANPTQSYGHLDTGYRHLHAEYTGDLRGALTVNPHSTSGEGKVYQLIDKSQKDSLHENVLSHAGGLLAEYQAHLEIGASA